MIAFPFKRIYGLVGAMRTGKDSVANFLIETRGFKQIAFADQIKEEFGISKEDFEAAKIAGNIEELRSTDFAFSSKNAYQYISPCITHVTPTRNSSIYRSIFRSMYLFQQI